MEANGRFPSRSQRRSTWLRLASVVSHINWEKPPLPWRHSALSEPRLSLYWNRTCVVPGLNSYWKSFETRVRSSRAGLSRRKNSQKNVDSRFSSEETRNDRTTERLRRCGATRGDACGQLARAQSLICILYLHASHPGKLFMSMQR